jgi:hypothetical protein
MPQRRTAFRLGDPQKSDALKRRFMPFVGKEYIKTVCVRHDLPYRPISCWLWKDAVLSDDIQQKIEHLLESQGKP